MTLTPSERIHAIKAIAKGLENEGWPVIDLTLHQFSAPTSDNFTGDTYDYVVAMLTNVYDDVLSQLIAHIGFMGTATPPDDSAPDFWARDCFRLFASHSSKDKEYVTRLQAELSRFHMSTFVAHKDITPTLEWQTQIRAALHSAHALVALLTPAFHESDWTDQEVGFVMGRGRVAVAVRLGREPYGFIGSIQAFQGLGKSEKSLAQEIFEAFLTNPQTSGAMNEALIKQFERSNGYISAQSNIKLLQQIKYPDPSLASRILRAVDENDQVGGAHAVPERVQDIAKKWQSASAR